MPVETIVSIAIALCALLFTAFSFRRTSYQDNSASATERATMTADIRYIRSSIDEIKLENRSIRSDVTELQKLVAEADAKATSAHKRIDDLMKKG